LCFHFFEHFFPGTLWANDVVLVLDEAFAHHRVLADGAKEALVVPCQGLKGHEAGASQTTFSFMTPKQTGQKRAKG